MADTAQIRMRLIDCNNPNYEDDWRKKIVFEGGKEPPSVAIFLPYEEKVEGLSYFLCIQKDENGRIIADDDLQPVLVMKTGRAYWEYTEEVVATEAKEPIKTIIGATND